MWPPTGTCPTPATAATPSANGPCSTGSWQSSSHHCDTTSPSDVEYIRTQIADIRQRLRAFDAGPGGWGIVHGDVQPLNHHLTDDGHITWLDFDLCGYGWRAYDIAYYYTRIPEPVRAPVIQGYKSIRPLSPAEHEMLPTMGRLAWIREGDQSKQLVKHLHNPYMSFL